MPRRSRRAVYDPTIENDQLMKTTLFRDDPLASGDIEEDIRQWSNASGMPSYRSKRKWCYLLTTVTTIALMVIVGITVRNKNSSDGTSNSSPSGLNSSSNDSSNTENNRPAVAPTNSEATLDPPISTLAQLCSRDRVEKAEMRSACEAECAKASCCAQDCNNGANASICQTYNSICEILLLTEVKPSTSGLAMPPKDLPSICALEQLATSQGYRKCESICETASCCHLPMSDPAGCSVPYHTECIAYYSSCGILQHVSMPVAHEVPMAPDNLPALCGIDRLGTVEGYEACYAACEPAQCCTATSGMNCFQEYATFCDEYAGPCSLLSQTVPPAPSNLPALCGVDRLRTVEGYEECESFCARATCCRLNGEASCANDEHCSEFQGPCSMLDDFVKPSSSDSPVAANQGVSSNRMHPPPSYIEELCTLENIQSSADGRQRCADICVGADCCQYPSNLVELSCLAGNEDMCAEYHSYCALLDGPSENNLNPSQWANEGVTMMTDIYTSCIDLTTPESLQACHEACSQARCCYTSGASSCIQDERCDDFDLCFNYKALSYVHENIPALIERNCADLVNLEGIQLCEASCEQALCCFAQDNSLECEGQDLSYCDQYQACEALMNLTSEDVNDGDQGEYSGVNSDGLFNNGMDKGEYNGSGSNGDNSSSTGDQGEYSGVGSSNEVVDNGEYSAGEDSNTEHSEAVDKGEYGAGSGIINIPDSTREQLEVACGTDLNFERCLTLCDKGRCCWNSNENDCANGINCSIYSACEVLV